MRIFVLSFFYHGFVSRRNNPTTGAGKVQRISGAEQEPSGTHRYAEEGESGV